MLANHFSRNEHFTMNYDRFKLNNIIIVYTYDYQRIRTIKLFLDRY